MPELGESMTDCSINSFSTDWFLKVDSTSQFGRQYRDIHNIPEIDEFFKQVQIWRCDLGRVTVKIGSRSWWVAESTLYHKDELPNDVAVELLTIEERCRMANEVA